MHPKLLARLQIKITEWLDENADEISDIHGIFMDDTCCDETSLAITRGADAVFEGMVHEARLYDELA